MTRPEPEPPRPLSTKDLQACAQEAGVRIPVDQLAGVLAGAQRLRDAALRLQDFLAEQER